MTTHAEGDELRSAPEDKTGQVQISTPFRPDEFRSGLADYGVLWDRSGMYDYDEKAGTWGWESYR
jgi:hypothetical protein